MLAYLYGIILVFIHFYNNEIAHFCHKYKERIISFGGGVSIAYLFLLLFPELYKANGATSSLSFIALLLGFSIFHIAEKHVYQHKSKKRILKELKEVHSIAFFIYHFLLGITIFYFANISIEIGLLFFIPIFFHSAVSNISLSELHHHIKEKIEYRIILALSPVLGILLAEFLNIPTNIFNTILGLVIGALLYVIIRDTLPKGKQGDIHYFIAGTIFMLLLLFITGQL